MVSLGEAAADRNAAIGPDKDETIPAAPAIEAVSQLRRVIEVTGSFMIAISSARVRFQRPNRRSQSQLLAGIEQARGDVGVLEFHLLFE